MLLSAALLGAAIVLQREPPKSLIATANALRKSGADVRVEDVEGHWEIWFELSGACSDKQLERVSGSKGLATIRLLGGGFGDHGISYLRDLPDLWMLVIRSSKLSDKCTVPISKLKGLTKLDIMDGTLTKVGVDRIASLPKLDQLYLHAAKLSDSAVANIAKCRTLRRLTLPETISAAVVSRLKKALPETDITIPRSGNSNLIQK